MSDFVKGMARGLTADMVGAPVDLATQILNLGLAGYGYAGNKLGLLSPSQMPSLIERPVGGSDWFSGDARSPLYNTGSEEFNYGRLAGGLAPLAPKALSAGLANLEKANQPGNRIPFSGQRGALYKGAKDPNLYHGHSTNEPTVVNKITGEVELPREFYNLSMGVTRDEAPAFGGASSTLFVPHLGQFDPKTWKSILTATDYYVPRYGDAAGSRLDEMRKQFATGFGRSDKRDYANRRLADRLGVGFPRGGFNQEGSVNRPPVTNLRNFGNSRDPFEGQSGAEHYLGSDIFKNRIWASPRAQSFAHFETDPRLGPTIGSKSGHQALADAQKSGQDLLANIYSTHLSWDRQTPNPIGSYDLVRQLKMLASGFVDPMARSSRGRRFDKDTKGYFDFDNLRVPVKPPSGPESFSLSRDVADGDYSGLRTPTPDEIKQIRRTAGEILSGMARAPSEYGELKVYGATQVNPANFAGILGRDEPGNAMRTLEHAAMKRGLPFERVDSWDNRGQIEAINSMQNAGRKTTVLTKGLAGAGDITQIPSRPSSHAGDYAEQVEKVKATFAKLKNDPHDLQAQAAFLKAADNFKIDSDLFVQSGKISNAEAGAMGLWLDKQKKVFGINTGVVSAKPSANIQFDSLSKFLKNDFTLSKFTKKDFDYLPDKDADKLSQYALDIKDDALFNALADYKIIMQQHGLSDKHDAALVKVIKAFDASNPYLQPQKPMGSASPVGGLKTLSDMIKLVEGKSLAELKALDVSNSTKLALKKYDEALEAAKVKDDPFGLVKIDDFNKINPKDLPPDQLPAYVKSAEIFKNWNYEIDQSALDTAKNLIAAAKDLKSGITYIKAAEEFTKPGHYFSLMKIQDQFPELTFQQAGALADYSWSLTKHQSDKTPAEALAAFAKAMEAK